MKVLAIDIGGTMLKIAETTLEGEILSIYEEPSEAKKGGPYVIEKVCKWIDSYTGYERIGISTAGQVNSEAGTIVYANENIPNYTGMHVKDIIEGRFKVPVAIENDVNAAAIGEAFYGAGKKEKDFLCLTYGTGIGGAIVIDSSIYKGAAGVAGEFGHILTHPQGKLCGCGKQGCYEQYASTTALIALARAVEPTCKDGKMLFQKIALGNENLKQVVDKWIDELMLGLVTLTHIFNPSCFILGGGILEQDYIIRQINDKIGDLIMPTYKGVNIKKAELGNKAGVLGATYIACK